MDPERFQRLRAIVVEAASMPEVERASFLDRACAGDPELRAEAESLLAHGDPMSHGLADPVTKAASQLLDEKPPYDRVGPYRLLRKVGEGGMGEVWMAEQSEPVQRRVAVKLIKWGMNTKRVVARFAAERQALAMMDHPVIAKVLDAGAAPDGRPYFVMELAHGLPVTEFCDRFRLGMRERLRLLLAICDGVQHAHRKGIIHRDIKPSNVLVEQQEGDPLVKIIDFGVAKAIEQQLTERTVYTEQGVLIGTPEYMSPEQAAMTGTDVDTRTDVYSLGVLLYELLAGVLPIDSRDLRKAGFEEILRRIREEDPPRPSARVSAADEVLAKTARRRRTNPRSLARELRGELDWITMKALEKDRERRYGSPSELAADIRRHLEGRPVIAGPPGAVYVLRKFARRHRLAVTLATVAILALAGFAVRERIQRERIGRERDRANRVSAFLTELFTVSDPKKARGREITVEEVLRRGSERIRTELAEEPEVQAALMHTMGRVYSSLGLFEEAEPLAQQAVAIRKRRLGREHPDTLRSMAFLAVIYRNQGRFAETDSLLREILGARRRTLGEEHPDTLVSMRELSRLLWEQGRYEEGVALIEQTLEIQERVLGPEHADTLASKNTLAGQLRKLGRFEEAATVLEEVVAVRKRTLGEDHPTTVAIMNNFGILLVDLKRYEEAEALFREVLETRTRVLGEEHPDTVATIHTLALVCRHLRRYDEAESLSLRAYEIRSRTLGADHPETLRSKYALALVYKAQGRYEEAERLLVEVLNSHIRQLGEDHPDTHASRMALAGTYVSQGRLEEAERLYEQALDGQRRKLGPEHRYTLTTMNKLASLYRRLGEYDSADSLFQELLEIERRLESDRPPVVLYDLACNEALRGDSLRALEWLSQSVDAGYDNSDWMARDPDLESLHGNPTFEALVRRAGEENAK